MTKPITVELTEAQEALLQSEAARQEVTPEALIVALVQKQVDYEAKFRAAVEEGLAAVERGDTLTHAEVEARARRRAAALLGDTDAP